jgi:hypothetical protein
VAKKMRAFGGFVAFFVAVFAPTVAHADQSLTVYPARVSMIGRSQVTLYAMNSGDTAYTVHAAVFVPWLALSRDHVKVKPGATAKLIVRVRAKHPKGTAVVTLSIPAPSTNGGITARGAVSIPLDFEPMASSQAPPVATSQGGSLLWPWALAIPLAIVATALVSVGLRRKRRSRSTTFGF